MDNNIELLNNLSDDERKVALSILNEFSSAGSSSLYETLLYQDYEEIPVDIHTFLHDKMFLGNGLIDSEGRFTVFPYWEKTLEKIFPDNLHTSYNSLVLTGCLGYDTEIPLLDGKTIKIGELAKKAISGNLDEYVYSFDVNSNEYVPGHLINAFSTGVKEVYKITLDNGESFLATSNHKFLTRDKHWKSVDSGLKIDDSLMPFDVEYKPIYKRTDSKPASKYQVIKHPQKDGSFIEEPTHRMVMRYKLGNYTGVVHHKDYNKFNNNPNNLQLMTWEQHKMFHAKRGGEQWRAFNERRRKHEISKELEQRILAGGIKGCKNRWRDPKQHELASKKTTEQMLNGFAKEMSSKAWNKDNREKTLSAVTKNIIDANRNINNINRYQISKATRIANLALRDFGVLNEDTYQQTKLKYNYRSGFPSYSSILKRISYEELLERADSYNHTIVNIEYVGKQEVYDLTVEKYHNFAIKSGIVAHNSIGIGKSFIAVICMLYLLHRMLCLKDPYLHYGLQPIDKITFSLINVTIEAAKGVAWDKMQQLLQTSPWFMAHGTVSGRSELVWSPPKGIELVVGSSNNAVIGRAVFSNFTDEVNFAVNTTNVDKIKKKQLTLITQIDARMQSRFMKGNMLPTLNIIASSKNSDQSFLETYVDMKKKNESKTTLIVDEPQWVIRTDKDTGVYFYVAVGNKFLASEVLPKDADETLINIYRNRGYQLLQVPIGYYEAFLDNVDIALTDIAGISTIGALKYISGVRVREIKTNSYSNPFLREVIEVGTNDKTQYYEFFDLSRVPKEYLTKPLYIHLDLSKSGDKTGIGGVWATKKVDASGNSELYYKVAFSVGVKAPKGYEISFEKSRNFIRWLRTKGFNIVGISSDTYQSAQIQQQLKDDGFKTSTLSVDRLENVAGTKQKICLPYQYFRTLIYEKKIELYEKCDLLTDEIIGLEKEPDGHINHPAGGTQGCFTGDTKVSLTDGRELSFLQLVEEFNKGKTNYVYSFNLITKCIEPKPILNAWCTQHNAELLEIELDNGETIQCTLKHRFMLRDGTYKYAEDLEENESLMPLYRKFPTEVVSMKNYRMYYEPIEDAWHYEHRRFATEVYDTKYLVHHKDCNAHNNNPDNLVRCSKQHHQHIHYLLTTGAHSESANKKRIQSLKQWYNNDSFSEKREERNKKIQDIENIYGIHWDKLTNNEKNSYGVKYQRLKNPETKERIISAVKENHKQGKYLNAKESLKRCNSESKRLKELIPEIDREKFETIFGFSYDSLESRQRGPYATKYRRIVGKEILNHKVKRITKLNKREDVYDITIQDNHNFALSAGVFVHNSKDIVDCIAGSCYNASLNTEELSYNYGDTLDMTLEVSGVDNTQTQLQVDFERELMKIGNVLPAKEDNSFNYFSGDDGIFSW